MPAGAMRAAELFQVLPVAVLVSERIPLSVLRARTVFANQLDRIGFAVGYE